MICKKEMKSETYRNKIKIKKTETTRVYEMFYIAPLKASVRGLDAGEMDRWTVVKELDNLVMFLCFF